MWYAPVRWVYVFQEHSSIRLVPKGFIPETESQMNYVHRNVNLCVPDASGFDVIKSVT